MFPPRNRHNLRLIRARALFSSGNKRKGLYAVLTIAIVCCVIFAFNTMQEQYDMELQDVVDDERRRMTNAAKRSTILSRRAPSSSMRPLPPLATIYLTPQLHYHVTDDWEGLMILPVEASRNVDQRLSWILYMKGIPEGILDKDEFPHADTDDYGQIIDRAMTSTELFDTYYGRLYKAFCDAKKKGLIPRVLARVLMLNSQKWRYEWVKSKDRGKPEYVLGPLGYRIQWSWTANQPRPPSSEESEPQAEILDRNNYRKIPKTMATTNAEDTERQETVAQLQDN